MGQNVLLNVIDQAYDHRSWHGTNLRGSLRRVSAAQAAWRPGPRRHNIWEIVVHAAYWKYAVWRRVTGAKRGSFELKGSNWFERPWTRDPGPRTRNSSEAAWRADLDLLARTHQQLRAAAAALTAAQLSRSSPGTAFNNAELLSGIAAHDLYHAGQIQLLKKLCRA
jgi:uncharacterized damage-inducible protein DinB